MSHSESLQSEESILDMERNLSSHTSLNSSLQPFPSGGQHPESNAAYFSWPTSMQLYGAVEGRANYFGNLQKGVLPGNPDHLPSRNQATTMLDLMTIRAFHSKMLRRCSLGTAIGFRIRKGTVTDIPAILVFVARKVHRKWLNHNQCLPTVLEGPGGVWCDVDVLEFSYYGAPAQTPNEHLYTELVDGLRGSDPCIGSGSQVMFKLGFSSDFIDLIRECITTTTISININGQAEGFITPTRGIRQGCPLSPYLFVICSEFLSFLINERCSSGSYVGMQIKRNAPSISHLMFADDLILFGEASAHMMEEIKGIFTLYSAWSRQQVNFEKSNILFSANMPFADQQVLASTLNVSIMDHSTCYLGNPLFQQRKVTNTYRYLESKVDKRINGWKCNLLSHAGREVLIKSSLASIPVYHMGTNFIPSDNLRNMERNMHDFFWGFKEGHRHIYLKAWRFLKKPKCMGGLGFRDLCAANCSMLASNSWRFISNLESTWAKLLKAKYFPRSSVWDVSLKSPSSPFWRGFMRVRDLIFSNSRWLISKGSRVDIFDDRWVSNHQALISKPVDWELSSTKVSALIDRSGRSWNAELIHDNFDHHTANLILNTPINSFDEDGLDILVWCPSNNDAFSPKNFYRFIYNSLNSGLPDPNLDSIKAVWKRVEIMPQIRMFIWRCLSNALPSNACRASVALHLNSSCPVCNVAGETLEHLFFECSFAKDVWDLMQLCSAVGTVESFGAKGKRINVGGIVARIHGLLGEGRSHIGNVVSSPSGIQTHWQPHSATELTINVDAAVRGVSSSWGLIVRLKEGRVSLIGADICDCSHASLAEAIGILHTIKIASSYWTEPVHIQSDAQVVNCITKATDSTPWHARHIIFECIQLLKDYPRITLSFCRRSCNSAAHQIAANAFSRNCFGIWRNGEFPHELLGSLCISPFGICLQ